MQLGFMEDDDNSNSRNQFNDDGEQNRISQQLQRTNIFRKTKQWFWYDIRNFPDALIIEILARLPVKSIFMFKSVCKHWQALISHPSFWRFYFLILNSNAASASRLLILQKYAYLPNFREFLNRLGPEIHSSSEFSVLFLSSLEDKERHQYDHFTVLNTSNGLILCRSRCWDFTPFVYYICDPFTRQWITLPRRESKFGDGFDEGLVTRVSEDHMLTGYKVVSVELVRSQSNYLKLEMFSSETGIWIGYKLPCTIPIQMPELGADTIHCYGALHWLVHNNDKDGSLDLLAFDPYKDPKSFRLIPLPHDRDLQSERSNRGACQLCGERQGTLCYFEVPDQNYIAEDEYIFTMWVMKDYEKGEWCCEFKVRHSDLHSNDPELSKWLKCRRWFLPVSFHPLNPNVVYLKGVYEGWVMSYDVLNGRLDVVHKATDGDGTVSWGLKVPFILPRWLVLFQL